MDNSSDKNDLLARIRLYNKQPKNLRYGDRPARPVIGGIKIAEPRVEKQAFIAEAKKIRSEHCYATRNPLFVFEGYSVYIEKVYTLSFKFREFKAKIRDKSNILIEGYFEHIISRSFVEGYVKEHINKIIREDWQSKNKEQYDPKKRSIDIHTFSDVNRRKDITDEEPLKVLKHKRKLFVKDPVKTEAYIGQLSSNLIGQKALGPDGRLITVARKDDSGLRDNNNK